MAQKLRYGKNRYRGSSSDTDLSNPTTSELADNLRAGNDVLNDVIAKGRDADGHNVQNAPGRVKGGQYPAHPGMAAPNGSPSGKVTAGLDKSARDPVRRP
jgi:hypothetical protein